jgi:hypothetical protein
MQRSASARAARAKRRLAGYGAVALCVVACATYEDVPTGNGDTGAGGESGTAGTPAGGSATGGHAGSLPMAGTSVVAQAGTSTSAGTANSAGTAGTTSIAGSAGTGGVSAGGDGGGGMAGEGGDGGAPPVVVDACPTDPAKTAPGVCGCGFPDADTAKLASCTGLKTALVHRYDFEGTGTTVTDRVGTAHGSVKGGATLSQIAGKGVVVLNGGTTGSYVDLPNKLLSALTNATLEAWVTWGGGNAWQRIFDFGDTTNATPEDNPANGKSYLFLTPSTDVAPAGVMRAVYSLSGGAASAETRLESTDPLPQVLTHVALVVDAAGGQLVLYVDGAKVGEQAFAGDLGSINDVNCWLGRSQYNADPELTGTFHDFRIYKAALTPLQIATSFAGGADPAFLAK